MSKIYDSAKRIRAIPRRVTSGSCADVRSGPFSDIMNAGFITSSLIVKPQGQFEQDLAVHRNTDSLISPGAAKRIKHQDGSVLMGANGSFLSPRSWKTERGHHGLELGGRLEMQIFVLQPPGIVPSLGIPVLSVFIANSEE